MHPESTPTWLVGPEIPPTQRIGTVLSGSYRLDAFLGQGLTGITYNAWHLRQKQPYAVKLLHRELQPSHERVLRLRTDLRVLSSLRKQGFLPVELSFAPDGAPFLASELLVGETLRERLTRGPLPSLAAGIVVAAVARALGEAHSQNVVHGDLRPENILLPSEAGREVEAGQPVLLDAALHHLRRRPIGLDESLPRHKLVYLAPEQASGEQSTADAAGDMFALGAIFYETLTGKAAFYADELEVIYEKLAQAPAKLDLPREVGAPPGLAEALDEVIARACARDPADRYPTMGELLEALSEAYKRVGLPLPPPDERVAIDTVLAQNHGLRKRTVAVKKLPGPEPKLAKSGTPADATAPKSSAPAPAPARQPTPIPSAAAETSKATPPMPRMSTPAPAQAGASSSGLRKMTPAPTPAATTSEPSKARPLTQPNKLVSAALPVEPSKALPIATPAEPKAAAPIEPNKSAAMPRPAEPSKSVPVPRPTEPSKSVSVPRPAEPSKTVPMPRPAEPSKAMAVPATAAKAPVAAEAPKPAAAIPPSAKTPEGNTGKHRVIRRTVKARDLGRLLAEVAAGRLDPSQAMALAAGQDDALDAKEEAPPPPAQPSEAERVIAEGRAAVMARAEAARKNRQNESDERMQRAQEQQKRILEQTRQETLARMRAEMADSRPVAKLGKDLDEKTATEPVSADGDLLAEAESQRKRLEAEKLEAERQGAEEAKRAAEENAAAELARAEAARAEAALREAEQRESARAEAVRVQSEVEAEARRVAQETADEHLRRQQEADAAEQAAEEAKQLAEEAAQAAEQARTEVQAEEEVAAWEDGLVEIAEPKRPPAVPKEAMVRKAERAKQALEQARLAEEAAAEASRRAADAREQAIAIERASHEARFAVNDAERARARQAADLAEAVLAAEAARSRDQELLQLAAAAAERAQAAEAARQRYATRADRVTQALAVLKQVQDLAQFESSAADDSLPGTSAAAVKNAASTSGLRPEPSGIYAGYTLTDLPRDPSGALKASQMPSGRPDFSGPYPPGKITPALEQATQSPTRPMPVVPNTPPPAQQPPPESSEVVEISAMLPASAIAAAMQNRPSLGGGMMQSGGVPLSSGPSASGAVSALPGMPPSMQMQQMQSMMGMPIDTRQMMMPPMMQPPNMSSEQGGVTLTVRQFVVTLTVTSLLSAIIGALIALLVMQRSQPIERPIIASRQPETSTDTVGTPPSTVTQPTPVAAKPPIPTPTPPQAQPDLAAAIAVVPTPTPPVTPPPEQPTTVSGANANVRPASVKLPTLRLSTDLPLVIVRPRVFGPGTPATPVTPRPNDGAATPTTPPAPETKPAEAKPAETKPAEAKPAEAKPAPGVGTKGTKQEGLDDNLRNPFGP